MTECVHPVTVHPITKLDYDAVRWSGATWIGRIEEECLDAASRLDLVGGNGFRRARLLVASNRQPRGFIDVPVTDGTVDIAAVRAEVTTLPDIPERAPRPDLPPISVAVCTRDHPDDLRAVLESLAASDYPDFELLVIDNNPTSGLTGPIVADFELCTDTTIRHIEAAGRGLSIARNIAIRSAAHGIVAFTDDDALVDGHWLRNLAYGFARDERVACVCGAVPSAELITPAQQYFDRRVGWASWSEPTLYNLSSPPGDDPLFPMHVARYGTGANFAISKDVALEVGGFDEALGVGSPTGGGEDIDMFVRVLLAGHSLVREPSAVVWHRHRRSVDDLRIQIRGYGAGLGAWIAKLLTQPRTLGMAVRRFGPAIRHLRTVTVVPPADADPDPALDRIRRNELIGVLYGPLALLGARVAGRDAGPLKTPSPKLVRMLDYRRGQMWGEPGNVIAAGQFAVAAVTLGLIGSLGAVRALPTFAVAIAAAAFLFAGPGSLVLSWYSHLPRHVLVPLVPTISVAVCLVTVTALLLAGFYSPVVVLLALTIGTAVVGLGRCGFLAHREQVSLS